MATKRRDFLKHSIVTTTGITLGSMGLNARSYGSILGANDRINIAVIGLGKKQFHGWGAMGSNYVSKICKLKEQCNIQVVSLCDVDEELIPKNNKKVYDSTGIKPKNEWDMRRVLDDKDVDVAFFVTPNHWHALGHIWACQAGKHIWAEKPLAYNVSEQRLMIEATRKYRPIVQVGQYRRSVPNAREAMKLLHEGGIGEVYMAKVLNYKRRPSFGIASDSTPPKSLHYDMWLGPAAYQNYNEKKVHYNFHFHWNTGNGDIANHGVHQLDLGRWGLNKNEHPVSVYSAGGIFGWKPYECSQETPDTQTAIYKYADGKILEFAEMGHYVNGVGSENTKIGVMYYGTEGYLEFDYHSSWRAFKKEEKEPFAKRDKPDPSRQDLLIMNFVDALRSGDENKLYCNIRDGHYSSSLCHLANISYRLGRNLEFMGEYDTFAGDDEANLMLSREYRTPYELPKVI
ncbi:MAG: Gfo/Idh/MocA family oxidoreductase [Sedimentisphaerales bacterium]|nr:Gfo/Idh/MocA family oxidoreductase [Sedimentisphaerales bacterium]